MAERQIGPHEFDRSFKVVRLDTLTLKTRHNTKEASIFGFADLELATDKSLDWKNTKTSSVVDLMISSGFQLPALESLNSTRDEELSEAKPKNTKDASTHMQAEWLTIDFAGPGRVLSWEHASNTACTGLANGSLLAKEERYQIENLNVMYPLEESVTELMFIKILVKTLQCIPNQFFQFSQSQVLQTKKFRLVSCSPELTKDLVGEVVEGAGALMKIKAFLREGELNECFKEAIEDFLNFYQRFLFELKEETLLKFRLKVLCLRSQLIFVQRVLAEIEEHRSQDSELIDMLLKLLEVTEIDFESNCIVRSFFVNLSKSFLEQLSRCVYEADMNPLAPFVFSLADVETPYDFPTYQRSVHLAGSLGVLSSHAASVQRCIRTVLLFKTLDKKLPPYWSVSAANRPVLKLEFTKQGFVQQEAALIEFAALQKTQLLEIEKQMLLAEEMRRKAQLEMRLAFLRTLKKSRDVMALAKDRIREEAIDKKRFFYELLTSQIQDNKARNEKAKVKAQLEAEKKRKEEEIERQLVEKGKRYLMEQYAMLVHNSKLMVVEWKARRQALHPKRIVAVMRQLNPSLMDLEVEIPKVIPEEQAQPAFERTIMVQREPPGGKSQMGLIMQRNQVGAPAPKPVYRAEKAIKFDSYSLVSEVFCDEILRKVYLLIKAKKAPVKSADYRPNFIDIVGEAVHIVEYPANLVWKRLVVDPLVTQVKAADQLGLHLFVRSLRLKEHLKALRSFALMGAGDTLDLFLLYMPSHQLPQSAWDLAVSLSSSRDHPLADRFKIQIGPDGEFAVRYEAEWPLNLVLHKKSMELYSKIFNWLLRMRRTSQLLNNCKVFFHNSTLRQLKGVADAQMRRVQLLRHRMHLFVTLLQEHVATVVHGSAWLDFEKALRKAEHVEELIEAHDFYLNSVISKCSLEGRSRFVIEHAKIMFSLVERLHGLLLDACPFQPFTSTELEELQNLEVDFNRVHRFLYTMTKSIAAKGQSAELFLRIDYNGFFASQLDHDR